MFCLAKSKFSDQLFVNKNTNSPNILKFHPYEPHLSVVSKSSVRWAATPTSIGSAYTNFWLVIFYYSVWDMEQGNKLSSFQIGGKLSVKITSVDYINPHDITFLLTGSGEISILNSDLAESTASYIYVLSELS